MEISTPVIILLVTNVGIWLIQFVVLRNDTKWIKKRLSEGNKTLDRYGRILSSHRSQISEIKGSCSTRHGTIFAPVGNPGTEEDIEGEK